MKRGIFGAASISAFVLFFTFSGGLNPVSAEPITLGVNPPLTEIVAQPPSSISSKIVIQNKGEAETTLSLSIKPFKMSEDGNGRIEYLPENIFVGRNLSIFQKIKVLDESGNVVDSLKLSSYESRTLTLTVDIGKEEPSDDYYFSILFISKESKTDKSSSQTVAGIGTNVLLSIRNGTSVNGNIAQYSAPSFLTSGPVPFTLLVQNEKGPFINPTGKIRIYDMFGRNVAVLEVLPQHILSSSKRYLTSSLSDLQISTKAQTFATNHPTVIWPQKFIFGFYRASLWLKLSPDSQPFERSIIFFAIPISFVLGISAIIFIVLGIVVKIKRSLRE